MRWQCALLKRWLPEYPDGDLPVLGKRWLKSHVAHCSACRRELADLKEMVAAIAATPVADPGPEFWGEFSRDMHLKLVDAAQEGQTATSPGHRWFRLPYLLGAPALAVLLLYVAVYLTGPGASVPNQALVMPEAAPKVATGHQKAPAPTREVATAPAVEEFVPVAMVAGGSLPPEETELSGWDLDSEFAGMTDQEKEIFLHKLNQREKDGSCVEKFSFCSWG